MTETVDWGTSLLFAAIVLLEGLRQVPPGAVVIRKLGAGGWQPVSIPSGLRLASWWAPGSLTVILPPRKNSPLPTSPGNPLERLGVWPVVLDALGGLTLLSLVVGLPVAARWGSGWGFLAGVALVFLLSSMVAVGAVIAAGRTGRAGWARLRWGVRFVNPFSAGRAGEALREATLASLPPLEAAQHLLEPDRFEAWLRPRIYDRMAGGPEADPDLDRVLSRATQRALLSRAPAGAGPGEPWCPRCGSAFQPATETCAECGVALTTVGSEK